MKDLDRVIAEQELKDLNLEQFQDNSPIAEEDQEGEYFENDINDPLNGINPNQKAFGEW